MHSRFVKELQIKDFDVTDILPKGVTLNILPFPKGKSQLNLGKRKFKLEALDLRKFKLEALHLSEFTWNKPFKVLKITEFFKQSIFYQ